MGRTVWSSENRFAWFLVPKQEPSSPIMNASNRLSQLFDGERSRVEVEMFGKTADLPRTIEASRQLLRVCCDPSPLHSKLGARFSRKAASPSRRLRPRKSDTKASAAMVSA